MFDYLSIEGVDVNWIAIRLLGKMRNIRLSEITLTARTQRGFSDFLYFGECPWAIAKFWK
jgi:hypothetical protein